MTPEQIELARHALGLPNATHTSNRNRFVTGASSNDHTVWMAMVEQGLAKRRPGDTLPFGGDDLFWLTEAGARRALNPRDKLCSKHFLDPKSTVDTSPERR